VNRADLGEVLRGERGKGTYAKTLGIALGIFFLGCLIAQLLFPVPYSIWYNHISDQGGWTNNPRGYLFFCVAVVVTGTLLVPVLNWIYRNLLPTTAALTRLAWLCAVVGAVGFSFVGAIPQDIQAPHDTAANFAFGGLGLAALLTFVIKVRGRFVQRNWTGAWDLALAYLPIILAGVGAVVFQNAWHLFEGTGLNPRLAKWPVWQWSLMLSILLWIVVTFATTPPRGDDRSQ
jgi:hypothetical membrane protein